jgi:hypothetical protein
MKIYKSFFRNECLGYKKQVLNVLIIFIIRHTQKAALPKP